MFITAHDTPLGSNTHVKLHSIPKSITAPTPELLGRRQVCSSGIHSRARQVSHERNSVIHMTIDNLLYVIAAS